MARRLVDLRKRMGISQDEMARYMGYSNRTHISAIESGQKKMSNVAIKCMSYLEKLYDNGMI
tara:strand:- start:29809 stop:29994 length:186 start_codon:yes stop_codon:yes gene_type:complete